MVCLQTLFRNENRLYWTKPRALINTDNALFMFSPEAIFIFIILCYFYDYNFLS